MTVTITPETAIPADVREAPPFDWRALCASIPPPSYFR
jgi:hypothetical protein